MLSGPEGRPAQSMPPLILDSFPSFDYAAGAAVLGIGLLWLLSASGNLERVWGWLTAGTKKRNDLLDKELADIRAALGQFVNSDALEKRFGGIEDKQKLMAAEVANQHNTLHEYERKRAELTGEFRGAISELKKDVHILEPMPGRVNTLETKLDNLVAQITDLKTGQRELKQEMREDMRSNKNEVLEAIAKINR